MLPAILYAMAVWKGEKGMRQFFGRIPPPIRVLYYLFWKKDFARNQLHLLQHLAEGRDYEPKRSLLGRVAGSKAATTALEVARAPAPSGGVAEAAVVGAALGAYAGSA